MGLAKVEQLNFGLSAGAVAATYWFVTPHFALSLAAGAFLEALNFGAMHRGAKALFSVGENLGDGEIIDEAVVNAQTKGWIGVFSLRFVALLAALYLTMRAGADPAAVAIGLSIAMVATVIDAWIHRPAVIDPATLPVLFDEATESEEDKEYWENYSIWRPGRLLTSSQPDTSRPNTLEPISEKRQDSQEDIE